MKFVPAVFAVLFGIATAPLAAQDHAGHDHAGHDHSHDAAEMIRIGTFSLLETSGTVKVAKGLKVGKDAGFEVEVTKPDKVSVLRLWIGDEQAEATGKSKGEKEDKGMFHVHTKVPEKLTDGDSIWVEIENTNNQEARTSITIPAKFRK